MRDPVRRFPLYGWFGLLLVAVSWPLNWWMEGMRTHLLFFPLWFGYSLAVDAWARARTGTSMIARSARSWWALFALSVPVWWLFELINERLANWEYIGREQFTDLEYALLASLSFSTVIPAVFGTAELVRGFGWMGRFRSGPRVPISPGRATLYFAIGLAMLAAMLVWPRYCFAFEWTSLVFLFEPLVLLRGRRGISCALSEGDWRPWMALWLGSLTCGFFWELWNVWSYPKWIYHVPFVGFWKIFEMPALGYLGYLPFGLELYLMAELVLPGGAPVKLEDE